MNIETKYEIGQRLWEIEPVESERKVCGHCGKMERYIEKWVVCESHARINGIYIEDNDGIKIMYKHLANSYFNEHDFDEYFFTTREVAQAECDRRNRAGK